MAKEYIGIGGEERGGPDASEAIANIPKNRTMLVQKLTNEPVVRPEIVYDLKTIEEVFAHFNPNVELEFEDESGATKEEKMEFKNLGDFGKKGIIAQSDLLKDLNLQQADYLKFIKQLKSNKILQKLLADPEAKTAYLNALQALIDEVENNEA